MATAILDEPQAPTIANLLEQLGNVPPWRVRLVPPPGQATEQDVLQLHAKTDRLYELVDGVLVEKAMGLRESFLAMFIGRILGNFVVPRRLGIVVGADGMMRLSPGRVRIPDVSFVSWDQISDRRVPSKPIPDLYPDLAVEVLSESNTPQEMELKRRDYFSAGTRLVWQIEPKSRSAEVYRTADQFATYDADRVLDGAPVLPGFSLSLAEIFSELDQQAPPATQ
jgi:Uma2 family endonuclease